MTTSGSSNFSVNRNDILQQAYELAGIIRTGQAMSSAQVTKGSIMLNAMIKAWSASGIRMWTVSEALLVPAAEQYQYDLGVTSTDTVGLVSGHRETTVSAAEASGQTVISVSSVTGMAAANRIAILLDDGTMHFTTISSVGASTVTIASALTSGAEEGAPVITFNATLVRPLKVVSARRRDMLTGTVTRMLPISRSDFRNLSNKNYDGLPSQFWYDPQNTLGQLCIYPREDVVTAMIEMTIHRPIEDFDTAADTPDLPQEWVKALWLGLALDIGVNIPEQRYGRIAQQLTALMDGLSGNDREEESLMFSPDMG
jgi:hypothetical protein